MFCENCEHGIESSYTYCPKCGQKIIEKLTLKALLNSFINNYFSVNSLFFKSFIPLCFKPAYLTKIFIEGKRIKFLHPMQFYLFISLIFFFLFSISTKKQRANFDDYLEKGFKKEVVSDTITNNANTNGGANIIYNFDKAKLDTLIASNATTNEKIKVFGYKEGDGSFRIYYFSQILKIYEKSGKQILDVFYDIIPIALIFFLPLFAFILKLLFYKNVNYSHHLVFSFHFFTFFFLLSAVYIILTNIFHIPFWVLLTISSVYLFIGILKFYKRKISSTLIKTISLMIINLIILLPFTILILYATVLIY